MTRSIKSLTDHRPFDFALALQPDEVAALADDLAIIRSSERGVSATGLALLRALQARQVSGRHHGAQGATP